MIHRAKPGVFWIPAKHTDKTYALLKATKELIEQKEKDFKNDCEAKLGERLKQFDDRLVEIKDRK